MPPVPSTRTTSFGGYNRLTGRSFVLPDRSRKLDTRAGFFSPSLDGGLPLFELFNPIRRSSSAIWALSAATSAMSSSRDSSAADSSFIESLNRSQIPLSRKFSTVARETMQPNLASYQKKWPASGARKSERRRL